jgi:3-phytase
MKQILIIPLILAASLLFSCTNSKSGQTARNTEAREDSLKMEEAVALNKKFTIRVTANAETMPVDADAKDDSADDPAIWVNTQNPDSSLIIGTNKKAGLYVFDLKGNTLQFLKIGKINNVDLRDGFRYQNKEVVLVTGTNRSNSSISVLYINKENKTLVGPIAEIPSKLDEVYGIGMYRNPKTNEFFAIINNKTGKFEQWLITNPSGDKLAYKLVKTFEVNSQPEGIAVDDETGTIYLGVEEEGVFKISANAKPGDKPVKLANSDNTNPHITYDIEGLALFSKNNKKYLMVSVQGNFSYAIYEIGQTEKYLGSFVIDSGSTDGVEETDGLEVTGTSLLGYPDGLIVVQDGFNYDGSVLKAQNFKYISLDKVRSILP